MTIRHFLGLKLREWHGGWPRSIRFPGTFAVGLSLRLWPRQSHEPGRLGHDAIGWPIDFGRARGFAAKRPTATVTGKAQGGSAKGPIGLDRFEDCRCLFSLLIGITKKRHAENDYRTTKENTTENNPKTRENPRVFGGGNGCLNTKSRDYR